jgi:hypothetical protein
VALLSQLSLPEMRRIHPAQEVVIKVMTWYETIKKAIEEMELVER